MNKEEFLRELEAQLAVLPKSITEESLAFYSEMIDDRIEEGAGEEEAISEIGPVDQIVARIIEDTPVTKLVKEKVKSKGKMKAWEIVFLALGSPIWISLLIALFAIVLSVYIVLWSLIISIWAVEVSFWAGALLGVILGAAYFIFGEITNGLILISGFCICLGLSLFLFYGCKGATKGVLLLTKKILLGIKRLFCNRGDR